MPGADVPGLRPAHQCQHRSGDADQPWPGQPVGEGGHDEPGERHPDRAIGQGVDVEGTEQRRGSGDAHEPGDEQGAGRARQGHGDPGPGVAEEGSPTREAGREVVEESDQQADEAEPDDHHQQAAHPLDVKGESLGQGVLGAVADAVGGRLHVPGEQPAGDEQDEGHTGEHPGEGGPLPAPRGSGGERDLRLAPGTSSSMSSGSGALGATRMVSSSSAAPFKVASSGRLGGGRGHDPRIDPLGGGRLRHGRGPSSPAARWAAASAPG